MSNIKLSHYICMSIVERCFSLGIIIYILGICVLFSTNLFI